jgi:tRNA 2-thiouridine synthesizing protein A
VSHLRAASDGAGDALVVDARGLRCPLPVIRLAARSKSLEAGTVVTVLATDPAAQHDVPAWARMRGHDVVAVRPPGAEAPGAEAPHDRHWTLTVRLRR